MLLMTSKEIPTKNTHPGVFLYPANPSPTGGRFFI